MKNLLMFVATVLGTFAAFAQRSTPLQLLYPAGSPSDSFGKAVAIDGDTMVVGANTDAIGANVAQGSAHVYRWTGSGWTFEASLTAADGAADDQFGISVAISGDTIIVSAPGDDLGANVNQGSVYVFLRSGSTWTRQAKLVAADGAADDIFGIGVAVSDDLVVVGSYQDDVGGNVNQGSAYVFVRTGSTWTQQAKLLDPSGETEDFFGVGVAASGDTVVVGAFADDVGPGFNQGSAHVFVRSGSAWTRQATLIAGDGAGFDYFGRSVAASGDTILVGAEGCDIGAHFDQGAAYAFVRSDGIWTQQAKLTAPDGSDFEYFGYAVAVSNQTAVIGTPLADVGAVSQAGAAHVFSRLDAAWTRQVRLVASSGAFGDRFGQSVAVHGDTAVVGAVTDDVGPNADQGSAWVFSRVGRAWVGPDLQMFASDGAGGDNFGQSVAISGDTAVIGASGDDVGTNVNQGSAYVFVRSVDGAWTQQAKLVAADGESEDAFGISVAISGDTVVIGAYDDSMAGMPRHGSAYVFVRSGSTWTQQAKLVASDAAAFEYFGYSVAIAGDTAMIGAIYDDLASGDEGSVYAFVRSGTTWTQQSKLVAADAGARDLFGVSIAMTDTTAVIGALYDDVGANADQGSAYVFVRSGSSWTQQAKLVAADGASSDFFGVDVAIFGDTVVVGAIGDDIGGNVDQGSVSIFVRAGSTWMQETTLVAADGAAWDSFGVSVSIVGNTVFVGAELASIGATSDQGAVLAFTRIGTSWIRYATLYAPDGVSFDRFGRAVGVADDTVIVGAVIDDGPGGPDQGSAWSFDVPPDDTPLARNDATHESYSNLAGAILPAQSGHSIIATLAAWRTIGSINTLGRSLALLGIGDIRVPSTSTIELGGASLVAAGSGGCVDLFGQFRLASGSTADIVADTFRLGSRGIMTARVDSSLSISAPIARLDGQTRLERGSALTFGGSVTAIGPTTCSFESSITAADSITNGDTLTVTAGTINAPLFRNRAQFNVFGSSAVFGAMLNDAGAVATISSGMLTVFGDLTNLGAINGGVCGSCSGLPPAMDVAGTLTLGPAAAMALPVQGSVVRVGGSFDCAIDSNTRFNLAMATLQLESPRSEVMLEVMSVDIGADLAGLDRALPGHFPLGELHIGGSPTTVLLVDAHDNALDGTVVCEALYIDTLRIDAGSRLINTSCRIYYNTLLNEGTVDVPANLISLRGLPCPADFNHDGGVDGGDMVDFFAAWEAGESTADVNLDDGVDGGDIDVFFAAWEAGGC